MKVKTKSGNKEKKLSYKKKAFIDIGDLGINVKDYNPKSIYDLKTKIKDTRAITTIKFLIDKLRSCDIDPEIYFMLDSAESTSALVSNVEKILYNMSSRKYDDDGKHIICVIQLLLARG